LVLNYGSFSFPSLALPSRTPKVHTPQTACGRFAPTGSRPERGAGRGPLGAMNLY